MREKAHYREQLALINERYPGKVMLTVTEVSEVLGICPRTVKAMIERKRNPLAAQNIGTGNKQKNLYYTENRSSELFGRRFKMTVYRIKFTRDFINSRSVNVPADTLADAYIKVQKEFPNCMIIGAKIAETKVKPVKDGTKWAQAIAKCLIDNGTIDDACEIASYLDEEQQEELVNAIWKVYHSGDKKEGA